MGRVRASWLIIIVIVLITVAVRPLREQTKLPLITDSLFAVGQTEGEQTEPRPSRWDAYRQRAPEFVKRNYPDDPEMLLAAGMLTPDKTEGLALLKQAAEKENAPAAWAAYAWALIEQLPHWQRLGEWGVDPTNPKSVAEAVKQMRDMKLPDHLDPKAAAPAMQALTAWEKADLENGLPAALETRLLYGGHMEEKARERWEVAAVRPQAKDYWAEHTRVIGKLFWRMGIPEAEALITATSYADSRFYSTLRQAARIAQYEGKVAQMQGRPGDALRWWNSSIALGRHLQDSSDSIIGYFVGVAIEGIGASPSWRWYLDKTTGTPGGPLQGGRLWYGRDHAFYVSQVGETKDAEVRDSLVRSKARSPLLHNDIEGMTGRFMSGPEMRGVMLIMLGVGAATLAALCVQILLLFGTWRRAQADAATRLQPTCQFLLALAPFGPLAVTAVLVNRMGRSGTESASAGAIAIACLVLAVVMVVFLPLIAAIFTRTSGARLKTAWRGNLRHSLPATAALAMLCFLALNLAAIGPRAEWVRQWSDPKMTEMAQVRQRLGEKWENPPIPKDAWRAEYPKLKTR